MSTISYDSDWTQKIIAQYLTPDIKATRQSVIDSLPKDNVNSLLDIGSGPGMLLEDIAERLTISRLVGADVSEDMVNAAQTRNTKNNIEYFVDSATSLRFDDESFDVVVSMQTLAYIDDLSTALKEAYRVLKTNGTLVILDTDWDCICWNSRYYQLMEEALQGYKSHCPHPYLPRQLPALLKDTGFKLESVKTHPIINTSFDSDTFSAHQLNFIGKYLADNDIFSPEKVEHWKQTARDSDNYGEYFYCLNRFIFVARKA